MQGVVLRPSDRPIWQGLPHEDKVITQALTGNDTNHITWSNIVGCMNGGARRRLTGFNYGDTLVAREYAAQHRVLMTDSFTEYQRNLSISPKWVLQDVEHLKSIARP